MLTLFVFSEPKKQQHQKVRYKALYDHSAADATELSFKTGDVITLVKKYANSEWHQGNSSVHLD